MLYNVTSFMKAVSKQATIYDVARLAGVSSATVSRVLNEPDRVAVDASAHSRTRQRDCRQEDFKCTGQNRVSEDARKRQDACRNHQGMYICRLIPSLLHQREQK